MTNNFERIKQLLKFESDDDFYYLQILKRKKENPDIGFNSITIKTYYITSLEQLESRKDEIIHLCDYHNARAYINLNVRSFETIAFHTLKKITDIIMAKDFKSARNAYESCCGTYGTGKNKSWIIDIDSSEFSVSIAKMITPIINSCKPDGDKIKAIIPTKNGVHLITSPFDLNEFRKLHGDGLDVHKNNPTILYIPQHDK